jgi:hypothetical protein
MMIMILLYWLMVMIGVFGMDAFDFDLDVNPDVGLDMDIGLDADLGIDADFGVDVQGGVEGAPAASLASGSSTTGNDGFLRTVFQFFYLGEVPIVIIGTFFALFFWMATFVTNHQTNMDQRFWISMMWLIPNTVVSLALTRITMIPFAIVFKKPPPENTTREEMYGIIGRITTSEVTDDFGQMEIRQNNEPEMTINVRTTASGNKLGKGDAAKIISYDNSNGTFLVELTKWEKKIDG